jgi:hypothetical protein
MTRAPDWLSVTPRAGEHQDRSPESLLHRAAHPRSRRRRRPDPSDRTGSQPRLAPELGYGKAVQHLLRTVADHTRTTGRVPTGAHRRHPRSGLVPADGQQAGPPATEGSGSAAGRRVHRRARRRPSPRVGDGAALRPAPRRHHRQRTSGRHLGPRGGRAHGPGHPRLQDLHPYARRRTIPSCRCTPTPVDGRGSTYEAPTSTIWPLVRAARST